MAYATGSASGRPISLESHGSPAEGDLSPATAGIGGTMTKKPAAIRFLVAIAEFILNRCRRLAKRWGAPGSGPFLAGC
jgi:hypothetical protein